MGALGGRPSVRLGIGAERGSAGMLESDLLSREAGFAGTEVAVEETGKDELDAWF